MSSIAPLAALLAGLIKVGQLRTRRIVESAQGPRLTVEGRDYLAFASNDYLGLANDPRLITAAKNAIDRYGIGAGASHMVSGHMAPHHELEIALARFMGMDSALYFGSGYAANLGILTSLAARGDHIFADKLNHACLNDGALLSNANFHRYTHGDLGKLRSLLAVIDGDTRTGADKNGSNTARRLVVTDAVFSMDGDIADLPQLLKIAEEFDALLVIDDAHGFGVLGKTGRGSLEHFGLKSDRIVYMATLGKAAGVYGAFVAGQRDAIEWILQTARTYLFSTATPPMIAAALIESLKIIDEDSARRTHLHQLIQFFTSSLKLKNCTLKFSETAIQPIIIGENNRTLYFADELKKRGIWVPAIRPPTVPSGTARLRVSLSAGHSKANVMKLIAALTEIDALLPSIKT
jgi:8-amino-7-oxononanoate synthase